MPLTNLLGEREALTQNSELYKEKITEYMKAWGYYLVEDSASQGKTADLVFEKPAVYGNRQAVVEAKWTDLSRFQKRFLAEIGTYFHQYMSELQQDRFDLYIFVRELQNLTKWRHIFEIKLQRQEDVEDYYERVMENDELNDDIRADIEPYTLDDFEQFIGDTEVIQADYDSLLMKIEEYEESEKFMPRFFTTETEPVNDPEELTANFVKISDLPETLYIGEVQHIDGPQIPFEGDTHAFPTWFDGGQFYSLIPPDELPESITQFVVDGSIGGRDFERWIPDEEGHQRIAQILLRELALYEAQDLGIVTANVQRGYRIFFEHENLDEERQRRNGRQVTRFYKDGSSPFVWHQSASLSVTVFSGVFYIVILPRFLFSNDGQSLIRGADNKPLYDRFSSSRYQNNKKNRGWVEYWFDTLGYGEPSEEPQGMGTELIELSLDKRPPSDVSTRDQSMEHLTMGEFQ